MSAREIDMREQAGQEKKIKKIMHMFKKLF